MQKRSVNHVGEGVGSMLQPLSHLWSVASQSISVSDQGVMAEWFRAFNLSSGGFVIGVGVRIPAMALEQDTSPSWFSSPRGINGYPQG